MVDKDVLGKKNEKIHCILKGASDVSFIFLLSYYLLTKKKIKFKPICFWPSRLGQSVRVGGFFVL